MQWHIDDSKCKWHDVFIVQVFLVYSILLMILWLISFLSIYEIISFVFKNKLILHIK